MKANAFNAAGEGQSDAGVGRCLMKMRSLLLVLSLGLASGCGGGGGGDVDEDVGVDPGQGGSGSASLSPVCDTLDEFVAASPDTAALQVSGYSFVLFNRERTVLTCSGGDQTQSTALPIASASKLASASAIMSLVGEGALDLDVPVATYLSAGDVSLPADKATITMRMLLSHTSGLPGLADASNPACSYTATQLTLQACAQQIADTPLVRTPGTAFNYGAAGYQLAGYIATVISGQNWQVFFRTRIAGPLNMPTFTYGDPSTVTNPGVSGGAYSNAADYAKLLKVLLAGGDESVLPASSVEKMQTDQVSGVPRSYTPVTPRLYPGYTLGFFVSSPSLHPGSLGPELSDPGLYGTVPWIDLDTGYGAVLLIRSDTATGLAMWNAVRPLIIEAM